MVEENEKIGQLISQVRQNRNLTQSDFAQALGTSQSAVNRMEHGKQNMSLDILARVSDVLNKQLLAINSSEATNLRIDGGRELSGSIRLKTSKNAAVGLLCASLLNHGVTTFKRFPHIEEVYRIIEVLESIGVEAKWVNNDDLEIRRPENLDLQNLDAEAARKTRSVLMMIGPLIHEFQDFKLPYVGGCKLGARTVAPHLYALEEFGVNIKSTGGYYHINTDKHPAGRIVLYESGNTVTENALFAAARTSGETTIQAASGDYMVQDVCHFLRKLGVRVEGIGSQFLTIRGASSRIKKNVTFSPTEDPIEAMFFITAAITTNSRITIERVPYIWIGLELMKLQKMGLKYTLSKSYKSANGAIDLADMTIEKHNGTLQAPAEKLHPNLYPGINPDSLPYFVLIAAAARGRTLIHDWIFENRAIYYTEVSKIGCQVELADPHRLYVTGPTKFTSADIVCPPALRPASLLLIGMLAAPGISTLRNIYTIRRGYEDLANRLNSLGAHITTISGM
jgi:UDP-N-acetylglucosamine 1-carboxyvinyltransferase